MKISVVTAAFRAEDTVASAIESVVRQNHGDIEHVVVEGASPDGTLAAIRGAAHPRMVLISEPDKGIYDALNKGIAHATGEVIGVVHADDMLAHDDVLDRIAAAFSDPQVDAVYGDLDYVAKDDTDRIVRHWRSGGYDRRKLARGWMPPHPTLYLRRQVFDRFGLYDTSFRIAADYDAILRYFGTGEIRPVYIPEVLVKMRMGGISNRNLARLVQKSSEDYRALRRNGIGGLGALAAKNLSKLPQFVRRQRTAP